MEESNEDGIFRVSRERVFSMLEVLISFCLRFLNTSLVIGSLPKCLGIVSPPLAIGVSGPEKKLLESRVIAKARDLKDSMQMTTVSRKTDSKNG